MTAASRGDGARSRWRSWPPRCRWSSSSCRSPSWRAASAASSTASASRWRSRSWCRCFVSFTLTPMLCARFLQRGAGRRRARRTALPRASSAATARILRWSLRHRWVIVAGRSLAVVASTVPLFGAVGKTFLPQDDQSEFEVIVQTPGRLHAGARRRASSGEIEERVRGLRGVRNVLDHDRRSDRPRARRRGRRHGGLDLRAARRPGGARLLAVRRDGRGAPHPAPTIPTCAPACRASTRSPAAARASPTSSSNLRGPDLARLQEYADQMMAGMRQMPGIVDVDTTLSVREPELRARHRPREGVRPRPQRAGRRRRRCRRSSAGEPVSKFKEERPAVRHLAARRAPDRRRTPQDIADLTVPSRTGQLVRLGEPRAAAARTSARRRSTASTASARSPSSPTCSTTCRWATAMTAYREGRAPASTCRRSTTSSGAAAPRRSARPTPTSRSPSCSAFSSCT